MPLDMATRTRLSSASMNPMVKASHELLGVPLGVTQADLKKAYRRLAMLYHPDRNQQPSAAAEFRRVSEAYELLLDSERVADLNFRHLKDRLHKPVIEGLEITFGSFFGYRMFDFERHQSRAVIVGLLSGKGGEAAQRSEPRYDPEMSSSVLDNAAFDAIEVVYAGRLSAEDEEQLQAGTRAAHLERLPWVVLNNQGILRFLDGDIVSARQSYTELCQRIPNNILFLYRLAICQILEGFKKPRRTLLGAMKPDRVKIVRGIELLRFCLKLGEERPVGRQKCLTIRKTLADVLEKLGRKREAQQVWREILSKDPSCVEAVYKTKGRAEAVKAMQKKAQRSAGQNTIGRRPMLAPGIERDNE